MCGIVGIVGHQPVSERLVDIAGDALSPSTTAFLAQRIAVWIEAVVK